MTAAPDFRDADGTPTRRSPETATDSNAGLHIKPRQLLPRLRERHRHRQPGERRVLGDPPNVFAVTTGPATVTLTAGSFTVGGVSYNYRSASLTANAALSDGLKALLGDGHRRRIDWPARAPDR